LRRRRACQAAHGRQTRRLLSATPAPVAPLPPDPGAARPPIRTSQKRLADSRRLRSTQPPPPMLWCGSSAALRISTARREGGGGALLSVPSAVARGAQPSVAGLHRVSTGVVVRGSALSLAPATVPAPEAGAGLAYPGPFRCLSDFAPALRRAGRPCPSFDPPCPSERVVAPSVRMLAAWGSTPGVLGPIGRQRGCQFSCSVARG